MESEENYFAGDGLCLCVFFPLVITLLTWWSPIPGGLRSDQHGEIVNIGIGQDCHGISHTHFPSMVEAPHYAIAWEALRGFSHLLSFIVTAIWIPAAVAMVCFPNPTANRLNTPRGSVACKAFGLHQWVTEYGDPAHCNDLTYLRSILPVIQNREAIYRESFWKIKIQTTKEFCRRHKTTSKDFQKAENCNKVSDKHEPEKEAEVQFHFLKILYECDGDTLPSGCGLHSQGSGNFTLHLWEYQMLGIDENMGLSIMWKSGNTHYVMIAR